jgi:dipeptidyl aminopeptidase/acylaminoacyl peptidase
VIRFSLLLSVLLAPLSCAFADKLPIDYFTRHDDFGELEISPDGAHFAASRLENGEGHITVYAIEPLKPVYGFRSGEDTEIDDFYWASPTRLLYTIAQRQRDYAQPVPTGEIFAVDRDGRKPAVLYGYRARAANPRPVDTRLKYTEETLADADILDVRTDDDDEIIIVEHPWTVKGNRAYIDPATSGRLSRLNVYSGKTRLIDTLPLGDASPLLDADDRLRFAMGLDAKGDFAVAWKPEGEWVSFELPGFRADSIVPQRFTPDNRAVLFTGTRSGESLSALYRLDLATQAVELLYAHTEADVNHVVLDLAQETVIGVRVYADKPEFHWLQPDHPTVKIYQMLERAFPGQSVLIWSVSEDQRRAVAWVYSDVNPGDTYLIDPQSRKADFLIAGRSWVDPAKMRHKAPVQFEARDGLRLHGYLTRPRDDAGPYPLVVLPHGGPHGIRDRWGYDWETQLLAHYGYAVLQVNFRGSGGYGVEFEEAGYREWGAKMQDDITDATLWAIEQKIAEKDNICIYGASYGGYAALMGAVREPDLYRCVASDAGVTDLELMFHRGDTHRYTAGVAYLETVLGTDAASLRARSPVYNAERIRVPVLLLHGKEDWRADYAHATRMRDALEKAGRKVELVSFGQEGHGTYAEENREEAYGRLLAFLAQNLRGGSAPASD